MRIYGSVALDGALFRKYSLRAGFDVYPPPNRKVVSMGDVLPDEARVLGHFRTALENWAAKRKLTTWAALDECHRGFLSRRVFMDRCAELGLPGADKAFRMLDVKGKGTLTAKDVAELKKWDAYNRDGTKRASMLDHDSQALAERSAVEKEESTVLKRARAKDKMHTLIKSQYKEKHLSDGHSVLPAPNDAIVHVLSPRRKHECKACAVAVAADDAVQHPTTWMQKLGVERKPPPGRIFLSTFPLVGELLDKESPYIDPALLQAKLRIAKPAQGKYRRQSTRDRVAINRGSLVGQGSVGRKRAAPIVQG
jgi:hypothetical protein